MFNIDYTSREPIYEQLYNNVVRLVSLGVLEAKQQLPPVRQLALQLNVNPNTVSKAYKTLEQDGIIYSVVGKGSFVMDNISVVDSKKAEALKETSLSVTNAMKLGVQKEDIIDIVDNVYTKEMKQE
ncbi:MAG: GntR family transcriptional regulator [Acutalibacteraceae bacterium]|nr:GntR family transcriptional regulator [Acutalibacteraceae bacterium]